ncbi:hypothetical protein CASFOL_027895 [Castilleja foliolosa]|uniref:Uncharacterized protein n=1 Tax=Castilleja foliolosa TaxID=1961234 RepID=A0ABD3CHY2_9LAMI
MEEDNLNSPAPAVAGDAASHVLPSLSSLSIYDKPPAAVDPPFLLPPPVIIHLGGDKDDLKRLADHLCKFGFIQKFLYDQRMGTCQVTYETIESKTALMNTPYTSSTRVEMHTSGEACSFNCGF